MKAKSTNTKPLASLAERESFPGIENLGNSCFANSILQVFNHTPAFLSHFKNYHCQCKGQDCYHCLLKNYINMVESSQSGESIKPSEILNALARSDPKKFGRGATADANEFFDKISEWLDDPIMSEIYSSMLKTIYHCKSCGHKWNLPEGLRSEGLRLYKCKQSESILDKLKKFSREKDVDYALPCEKCGDRGNSTEKTVIVSPPRVLQIRIAGFNVDDYAKTYFPDEINIRPYMEDQTGSKANYELFAVVVASYWENISHSRESATKINHYFALCKPQNGQWNLYNDAGVYKKIPLETVQTFDPYLLFYRRKPPGR